MLKRGWHRSAKPVPGKKSKANPWFTLNQGADADRQLAPAKESAVAEREMILGKANAGTPEEVVRCIHCERTYQLKDARLVGHLWLCAYADCDGDVIFDAQAPYPTKE